MRINNIYNYGIKQKSNIEKERDMPNEKQDEMERIKKQFENSAEETKNSQEGMKILIMCLKISRRIISGDIVPTKDHEFLKKHDPTLYSKSILMRVPKKKPYKYKQLSEDDNDQNRLQNETIIDGENFNDLVDSSPAEQDISDSSIDIKI